MIPSKLPPPRKLTFEQAHRWAAQFIKNNAVSDQPVNLATVQQWMMGALMAGFVRGCESLEPRIAELESAAEAEKERGKN